MQSHALSFFHLSSPDLLLGMDSDPASAIFLAWLEQHPQLARDGVRLRQIGQQIIERMGGKRIHPAWVVPGGVSEPLSQDNRDAILETIPEACAIAERTLDWFKTPSKNFARKSGRSGISPLLFMGIVKPDGGLTFYDGKFRDWRCRRQTGRAGDWSPAAISTTSAKQVEPESYLKSPYYKPQGYPEGIYRVGPLARLNVADRCGTPHADQELAEFRELAPRRRAQFLPLPPRAADRNHLWHRAHGAVVDSSRHPLQARARLSRAQQSGRHWSVEAPRGTLIHHYKMDEQGLMRWANLIIATGHNNLAMNRGILQVAKHFVHGNVSRKACSTGWRP